MTWKRDLENTFKNLENLEKYTLNRTWKSFRKDLQKDLEKSIGKTSKKVCKKTQKRTVKDLETTWKKALIQHNFWFDD